MAASADSIPLTTTALVSLASDAKVTCKPDQQIGGYVVEVPLEGLGSSFTATIREEGQSQPMITMKSQVLNKFHTGPVQKRSYINVTVHKKNGETVVYPEITVLPSSS